MMTYNAYNSPQDRGHSDLQLLLAPSLVMVTIASLLVTLVMIFISTLHFPESFLAPTWTRLKVFLSWQFTSLRVLTFAQFSASYMTTSVCSKISIHRFLWQQNVCFETPTPFHSSKLTPLPGEQSLSVHDGPPHPEENETSSWEQWHNHKGSAGSTSQHTARGAVGLTCVKKNSLHWQIFFFFENRTECLLEK